MPIKIGLRIFLQFMLFFIIVSAQSDNTDQSEVDGGREAKKSARLAKVVDTVGKMAYSFSFQPNVWSPSHNPKGPAIFALATYLTVGGIGVKRFCQTARNAGFEGDIVLAIYPNSMPKFIDALKEAKAIAYNIEFDCEGTGFSEFCSFKGSQGLKSPVNMMRYYLYQIWGLKYDSDAMIMLSDFRDVFFQSNPFTYRASDWLPPIAQLVVFQEPYPNKVIYRCNLNSGWVKSCYGQEALNAIGSNSASSSGLTMGTRNAILGYSFLMTQQLSPKVRHGKNTTKTNQYCLSFGMDQGFHNWLVYSGQLSKYMTLKIYQQGEGPVNNLGAFAGARAILPFTLEQMNILRGAAPNKTIHNWNGDLSPVVHQADVFLGRELAPSYKANLAALSHIG